MGSPTTKGLFNHSDNIGPVLYAPDTFPAVSADTISPHLIGFWPLSHQKFACARDTSGRRNHFYRYYFMSVNALGADGWLQYDTGASPMRLSADPLDPRGDITAPGASFVMHFETRQAACTTKNLTVLAKGMVLTNGIGVGMVDNASTAPRLRVVIAGTDNYSSNFPSWNAADNAGAGTEYRVGVVRDGNGSMGTAGRVYVYINGVLDADFDGPGYTAYAPTVSQLTANLSLLGYGLNVTGADASAPAAGNHIRLRNLQLAIVPSGLSLPTLAAMNTLMGVLNTAPSRMLTAGDLP